MVTIFRYVKWPETPGKIILVPQFNLQTPKSIFPSAEAKVRISDRKYLLSSPHCVLTVIRGPCSLEEKAQLGTDIVPPSQQWEGGPLAAGTGKPRLGSWLTPLESADVPPGPQEPIWFSGARLQSKGSPPSTCFCWGGGTALWWFISQRSFFFTTLLCCCPGSSTVGA